MPDNKDFLDQFSDAGKPASFKEEERVPVKKEKKPLNTKALAIAAGVLLLLAIASYFLFFAPKIEMPNFVGMTKNDVAAWVKQQGVDSTGVLFTEQFDFDTEAGTILSQSVTPGKKVKNDVKVNFALSKGADPDERIIVPDLYSMEKEDVQTWISDNKLQKTKISTSYNEDVEANGVIDYVFTGCEEDSFTRGCSLKINISKGSAPAGKVTVEDFVKKTFEQAETWAKTKKVNVSKTEQYSDQVDKGLIISQSIVAGRTMNEGDTLNLVVSLGKAVYMPNMIGWNASKVSNWQAENGYAVDSTEKVYSDSEEGEVISQNIQAGKLLGKGEYIKVTVSLGNVVDFGDHTGEPYHGGSGSLHEMKDRALEKGAGFGLAKSFEFSDTIPAGYVIYNDVRVNVGGTLTVIVSRGKNILLENVDNMDWQKFANGMKDDTSRLTEEDARRLLDEYKKSFYGEKVINYSVEYVSNGDAGIEIGEVISAKRTDGELMPNTYLPQDESVIVYVKASHTS
ncbi:MAG: PASTA domain-containing protein [Erysipelotrichaceae bacterium]|nr:PASTA domain-containing protein [Erysipelotrichaceae bacterium]